MDTQEFERRAGNVIFEHLGGGELWTVEGTVPSREHKLGRDLGADSLDVVEIVMALEDEFKVEIPDDVIDGRYDDLTVGEFYDAVFPLVDA